MTKQQQIEQSEIYYQQNVRNPYPEDSQSNTAYKKGFYECAECFLSEKEGEADRQWISVKDLITFAIYKTKSTN